jgi:hypothetical protein
MIRRGESFVHHFNLPIDHLTSEPVDRHVHPITLLVFNDEVILWTCCVWFVVPSLRDQTAACFISRLRFTWCDAEKTYPRLEDAKRV